MKYLSHPRTFALLAAASLALAACQPVVKPKAPVVPVAPPPVPQSSHVSLSADALFGFGKADIASLNEQGKGQLDEVLAKLRSARQVQAVQLLGYTDRLGTDAYNLQLSQRRADAVRAYLAAHGVDAAVIEAQGRGKADPVADCPTLKGKKLLACLAPNRRVEVNLTVLTDAAGATAEPSVRAAVPAAPAAIKTVYISPRKRPCNGLGATECYQVREREDQPWSLWYGQIEGFDYQPGIAYTLRVKEYRIDPPPADAPSVRWVLDEVVAQQKKRR